LFFFSVALYYIICFYSL